MFECVKGANQHLCVHTPSKSEMGSPASRIEREGTYILSSEASRLLTEFRYLLKQLDDVELVVVAADVSLALRG
jgi:hypothetical protein